MIIGIIAIVSTLFGAGGDLSFDAVFAPFVKEVVTDEQRYDQIAANFDAIDKEMDEFRDATEEEWANESKALLANYDATREDFHKFRRKYMPQRDALLKKLVDVRFKTVELMTEDEWKAMFKAMEEEAKKKDDD